MLKKLNCGTESLKTAGAANLKCPDFGSLTLARLETLPRALLTLIIECATPIEVAVLYVTSHILCRNVTQSLETALRACIPDPPREGTRDHFPNAFFFVFFFFARHNHCVDSSRVCVCVAHV
jgi:hypothetical protein